MTAGARAADLLAAIVAGSRRIVEIRRRREPIDAVERRARQVPPTLLAFVDALARPGFNVIAECKRRSPSRGVLRQDFDPVAIARSYAAGGAAALSVLTEPTFFDGSLEHLEQVRRAVPLPVLRKDFIVDEYQVVEARAAGAGAVLLIAAALDDASLSRLLAAADRWELAALVEVHDTMELTRALEAGSRIVGVNNRNLRTLEISIDTAFSLAGAIPDDRLAVAESGIREGADLRALRHAGYDAFLVGERLMTASDPGEALRALLADAEPQDDRYPDRPVRAMGGSPGDEAS